MSITSTTEAGGPGSTPGYELPLLLLAGFRAVTDEAHAELAGRGHPEFRPVHAFAMQAIGTFGATAADVGRRLGVSKQAAGKTVDRLAELGYVERGQPGGQDTAGDRRRKLIRLTPRGTEALRLSAEAFDRVRARWAAELGKGELGEGELREGELGKGELREGELGEDRLTRLEADLRAMTPGQPPRLDIPGWLGA